MQQLPDLEKVDSKKTSDLKWTMYNGRRKVCVNFRTDTDNLNIVVYRYRKNFSSEIMKLTENQSLLAKRVYLLSYINLFHERCILPD